MYHAVILRADARPSRWQLLEDIQSLPGLTTKPAWPAQTVDMLQERSHAMIFRNAALAVTILIAPIMYCLGGILDPVIHVTDGAANIAANASANQFTNNVHLASFVLGSFVLPISIIGIAGLVQQRSPWLATVGGGLGLLGWLPMSALTAQEDLTLQMARLGGGTELLGTLWERFNNDATMTIFLVFYIVGHLAAYVVLAIGLWRARIVQTWVAWTLGSTTPLMLAFFATRQRSQTLGLAFEIAFMLAFVIGSVPVAYAALTRASERAERSTIAQHQASGDSRVGDIRNSRELAA